MAHSNRGRIDCKIALPRLAALLCFHPGTREVQRMRRLISLALTAAMLGAAAAPAWAQSYPERPIRLFVSYPPGGAADIVARAVALSLSPRLGQPVVVENRPGSNGNIAGEVVAHAAADGYTLMVGNSALFGINPHLYRRMPFDPGKDLLPVASLVANALLLAANPALPPRGLRDFIDFARSATPPLFYASIGIGSEHHLAMELLKQRAGIELTHVPYKGGGPAALGVMAGDVAAMFGGGSVTSLVLSGKLRGLATSGSARSPVLPDLPAIAEFYPGYEVTLWQGLFAPVGTPPQIVERLRRAATAVLKEPGLAEKLAAAGAGDPWISTQAEFAARIRADYERYGRVIASIGLRLE
jgi:tripartite-type tricarboxylate transporter receptor subunit TctC